MIKKTSVWLERNIGLNKAAQFMAAIFIASGALLSVYSVFNALAVTNREVQSSVQILVFDKNSRPVSSGSGTVIDMDGDILTNFHVIKNAVEKAGWSIAVCITSDAKKLPVCGLLKVALAGHSEPLDLALLRFTEIKNQDGKFVDFKQYLADNRVRLDHVKINRFAMDDEGLALGDAVQILGYPDAGGSSITVTRGIASGFEQLRLEGMDLPWLIKTDAKVNPGNSGGGAFDANDNYIGVPKAVAGGDGNIGYIVSLPVVNYFLNKVLGAPTPQTGLLCVDLTNGFLGVDGRCYCNPSFDWSDTDHRCVSHPAPEQMGVIRIME